MRFAAAVRAFPVLLALAALAASGGAGAQGVLVPQAPAAPPQDVLARAASSVGVKRCLPAITRLSSLMVQGSRSSDVLLDWDRRQPDVGPLFSLIGLEFPNAGVAGSITAIPEQGGTCTVSAERISVAPYTCASIAQKELVGYQMTRLLPIFTVYTDAKEPTSSVSLIDSPPGCLVIRRFVEYSWKDPKLPAAPAPAPAPQAPGRRQSGTK
jgi:hypothetical protein